MNSTSLKHDCELLRFVSWDNLTSLSSDKEEARKNVLSLLYATDTVKPSDIVTIEFGEGDQWFTPRTYGKWKDQVPLNIKIKKGANN